MYIHTIALLSPFQILARREGKANHFSAWHPLYVQHRVKHQQRELVESGESRIPSPLLHSFMFMMSTYDPTMANLLRVKEQKNSSAKACY